MPEAEPDAGSSSTGRAPLPGEGPGGAVRDELLAVLEIGGLTALAFTRPVLDSFGRAPETFIARGASARDVALFAVAVAVLPALAVCLVGALTRLAGARVRRGFHLAALGLLAGLAAWRFGTDTLPWGHRVLVAGAVVAAAGTVVLRHRVRPAATYLRYVGAASVVFLVQFLVLSPTAGLVTGSDEPVVHPGTAEVALADTGEHLPPIVVVVLDALPTTTLLDGSGRIDADLFPHFAELAGDATWYRNHSTTSAWTYQAVPALLSGRLPEVPSPLPDTRAHPGNLFTLLGETHDITAVEQISRLCPTELCPPEGGSAVPALLGDAVDWWRGGLEPATDEGAQVLPGALEAGRGDEFVDWIEQQDFGPGDDPGLWFYHLLMPHDPWVALDDMAPYEVVQDEPFGLFIHNFWGEVGADVARQRHVLQTQAVDTALGVLLDRLRAAGTYDDTLVAVVGDHGEAYAANRPMRALAAEQFDQVAWTPFILKAPGQREGVVDDGNVWNIDLVPTIADVLGIELPWEVDGVPASRAGAAREPGDKRLTTSELHELPTAEDGKWVHIDGVEGYDRLLASDQVEGEGDLAVWRRTEHGGLVGRQVDTLDIDDDSIGTLVVDGLGRIESPGDGPPVIELIGYCRLQPGETVAVAVNGVVVATAPVEMVGPGAADSDRVVHALLLARPFAASNTVEAFRVDGPPGAETLTALTVLDA